MLDKKNLITLKEVADLELIQKIFKKSFLGDLKIYIFEEVDFSPLNKGCAYTAFQFINSEKNINLDDEIRLSDGWVAPLCYLWIDKNDLNDVCTEINS